MLPGGRGNDFARVLGIPLDPVAACAVIAANVVRELDLGVVDDRTFISIASCGFDSEANRIANETRLVRGNLVYAYGALRALAGWRPARFEVTLDGGEPRTMRGYTVAVANSGAYGGGMLMAPSASLDDGTLDVVMVERRAQAPIPATAADGVQGRARPPARRAGVAGARGAWSRPTARSRCMPTATRSPSYPRPSGSCRAP